MGYPISFRRPLQFVGYFDTRSRFQFGRPEKFFTRKDRDLIFIFDVEKTIATD